MKLRPPFRLSTKALNEMTFRTRRNYSMTYEIGRLEYPQFLAPKRSLDESKLLGNETHHKASRTNLVSRLESWYVHGLGA